VEDRILTLAMAHAAVRQPVPARLAADLSKGYKWTGGRFEEQPFEYTAWAPAGGMSVSGHDMGRFMLAHLGHGAIDDARILRAESAKAMQQRPVSFSPKIDGMLHGIIERNVNGETSVSGATIWFHKRNRHGACRNLASSSPSTQTQDSERPRNSSRHSPTTSSVLAGTTAPTTSGRVCFFSGSYAMTRPPRAV
jgi:CubicO group peptidase (beta-lactamase class C family)